MRCSLRRVFDRYRLVGRWVMGDKVMGGSNFLNFRGIRNARKFAVSPSLGLTDWPIYRLAVSRLTTHD
jgi:hypothetical protein